MFSYVAPQTRVRVNRPSRAIHALVRDILSEMNRSFAWLYSKEGRPSVPPEQLLSALLIQVLYGVRSERQLMEQLDYNLLYRWFVGLSPDDPVWNPTTFTKNRKRLQNGDVFQIFMSRLVNHPKVTPLLSDEHFSVDGTLIEAWARRRVFRRSMAVTITARIFIARSARMIHMPVPRTQRAGCIARPRGVRQSFPTWATR